MATADVGSKERIHGFKRFEAVMTVARDTFQTVIVWAKQDKVISKTPADDSKKPIKLNKTEKDKLSDPSFTKPDITLQYKVYVNEYHKNTKCNDKLEPLLKKIKNFRNEVAHEGLEMNSSEFKVMSKELEKLLSNTLTAAKESYDRTDAELQEKIKEMKDGLFMVFNQVLGTDDLLTFDNQAIIKEFVSEAKTHLQNATTVILDPLHFLPESGVGAKVADIFSKMQVGNKDGHVLDVTAVLSVADLGTSRPQLLLTEGPAGSGKSTLLMLVTDEWLKGCHGQIKDLDKYQLILRLHCRDRHLESLDDLLKDTFPGVYSKHRNLTLPIFKQCNLLILIDGIDEVNEKSSKVLDDVLNTFKNASNTTLLITSRPEVITKFMTTRPTEYQVKNIKLLGIAEEDRLNFVIKYISLFQDHKTDAIIKELQPTLKKICRREHFNLPLNLVFLAWQSVHDPSGVTEADSQTQLYFWADKLNIQKLLERLMKRTDLANEEEAELKQRVNECLKVLHQFLFNAAIDNQVIFTEQDMPFITRICDERGIPSQEVLSMFFTKKTTRTPLGNVHQYSAPHKGLQDYYGALHVVNQLQQQQGSTIKKVIKKNLWSHLNQQPISTIKKMKKTLMLLPMEIPVEKFVYILLHLAGLLHRHITSGLSQLQDELVHMLHKSGVESSGKVGAYSWEKHGVHSWGEVVEGAQNSKGVIEAITRLLRSGNVMEVRNHVGGHSELLKEMAKRVVWVDIQGPPPDLTPLKDLLTHHTFSTVFLHHYFLEPQPTTAPDPFLQALMSMDELQVFSGQWSGWMIRLPSTLTFLEISVTDDDSVKILLPEIHSLTHLGGLGIHVGLTVTPAAISTSLPDIGDDVYFRMKDLTEGEIDRACQLVAKLQPRSTGYDELNFDKACLPKEGWKRLLEGFIQLGVRVKTSVNVPEDPTTEDPELQTLYMEKLGCNFLRFAQFSDYLSTEI